MGWRSSPAHPPASTLRPTRRDALPLLMGAPPEKPHYLGHRQRLRQKLLEKGSDSLADYELLELLKVPGMGEAAVAALKTVRAAALLMTRQELTERPVIANWQSLLDYCRASLAEEKIEQFHLLFLDGRNALIAHEKQQTGTVNHAPVYPREVAKRALELGARAIIMGTTIPLRDPTPSRDDVAITKACAAALEKLDIMLHDHVVVGRKGHASLRSLGLI